MLTSDGGTTWTYQNLREDLWHSVFWECTYCGEYPIFWVMNAGVFRYEEVTGITEGIFEEIYVSKHQTSSEFSIKIQDPKFRGYEILISDMQGKQIAKQLLNTADSEESIPIDLSGLPQGAYLYLITCNNSLISSGKFVNVR